MSSLLVQLLRVGNQATRVDALAREALAALALGFGAERAYLRLWGEGQLRVVAQHPPPPDPDEPLPDEGLSQRAVRQRALVVEPVERWPSAARALARHHGLHHGAVAPLVATERVVGTLCLLRGKQGAFSDGERQLFELCAAYLAQTVEQVRLVEAERRRVEDLQRLLEVSRAVTGSLEREQLMESAGLNLARLADATHAFIWLQDPKSRALEGIVTSAEDTDAHFRRLRLEPDEPSLALRALEARVPVRVEDALHSPLVPPRLNQTYRMRSMFGLPLMVQGRAIGAVTVGDAARRRPWTEDEVERATLVAGQLAVSLAHAQLYQDLRASYAALERAQAQLVERERLAALGELSAVVAHEVRNPLGVIYNSMSALRRMVQPAEESEQVFDMVDEECERLNAIIGDLLDFARPRPVARVAADLAESLNDALRGLAAPCREAGIAVTLDLAAAPRFPQVDERMLRQALAKLLSNAVQAMPQGGELTVRALEERPAEGPPRLRVDVRDTGPGLSAAVLERLFQPFFTTRAAGSGLGLAVVKRIAEAHGGDLSVETAPGKGACFTLRLPLVAP